MGVRLPPEYQEVTCIIGQGAQYIDTGYVLNSECRVQGRYDLYESTKLGSVVALFGARDSNYNNAFAMFNVTAAPRIDYGKTLTTHSFYYVTINDRSVVDFDLNAGIATVNGCTYAFADSLKPFTCPSTALIFAAHTENTVDTRRPKGEIVYLKITDENGIVVRDMIPCYRKADNKPGMYDLVSKTFYTNQGTGEFLVGPDVIDSISPWMMTRRRALLARVESGGGRLPIAYQEVEYLESTGTQYINTGYYPNNLTDVECKFMYNQFSGNIASSVFGVRDSDGTVRQFLMSVSSGVLWIINGLNNRSVPSIRPVVNTEYVLRITPRKAYWNGTDIFTMTSSVANCPDYSMFMFGRHVHSSSVFANQLYGRIYYLKIYEAGVLVRNFIPCINPSNVAGMYDTVNGVFYTNAGIGDFQLPS